MGDRGVAPLLAPGLRSPAPLPAPAPGLRRRLRPPALRLRHGRACGLCRRAPRPL